MLCEQECLRCRNTEADRLGWRTSGTFNNLGDLRLVGVKLEGCQEAQGAQVEGHNWWNALLQINKRRERIVMAYQ